MALIYNTLRNNLLALFAWLGMIALGVLVWNLGTAVSEHFRIQAELGRGAETDALIQLSYDLRREDMALFQALSGEPPLISPQDGARSTDAALDRTAALLVGHDQGGHAASASLLSDLRAGLDARRAAASAALRADEGARQAALHDWRRYLDAAYPDLEGISHDLIAESGEPAARIAQLTTLRYYALFAFRALIANRFAIEDAVRAGQADAIHLVMLSDSSAQLRGAANLAEDQFLSDRAPAFGSIASATDFLVADYLPAEMRVLEDMLTGTPRDASLAAWRRSSHDAVTHLTNAEAALAAEAGSRLRLAEKQDHAAIMLWGTAVALALALLLSAVRFTLHRIVSPLEQVHSRMLRLANDDLTFEPVPPTRLAEIQVMYDALAVFRENALRREKMQAELARLNDRVVAANHSMTAELEAAARVQAAQLPPSCDLPGAQFHAFYRPSRMIAGDTYDYVSLPDGRTRLFQIDVSGHGAAAALVSVMSHIAVKTALQQAAPSESLADIISRINREWSEELPYFTMLLVEIDPRAGTARVVQAGHPPLLRLPLVGGVETVGDGGMPVGALPWAEYEELTCAFHPGDRLILTTDGVTEAADADGNMFGDDRYLGLLARPVRPDVKSLFASVDSALWDWCGTEAFDDDVTILILEAKEPTYAH
ncbi:PP2C family protein-serine/threonine phosphatase [Paragemmobacter straminiformis]|uniref:Serine/threonine-protein phosphatase n=1 Tax=Paragemmobacter straminiformis TaxID=2045119 RepID=A0A842IGI3_9RHOB|nr:PP2C family protein-serine/threonine phosphatase [Gemmobacter straminiformis]MBC2837578.1 serine/threonine-protein phosphatase [Gemmobacter straminiformis]